MNRFLLLFILIVFLATSCKKEIIIEPNDGRIFGEIKQLNENGLVLFNLKVPDPSEVFLEDDQGNVIRTIFIEAANTQEYSFDSLEYGTYSIYADAPSYKSCQIQEVQIDNQDTEKRANFWLKSIDFSSTLTSFEIDSLVEDLLWYSIDVAQDNDDRLKIRFYLSDQSNVSNQNYIETVTTNYIKNSQVELSSKITPDLYSDSIYIRVHLENPDADECLDENNAIYYFPQSQNSITVGISK